MPKPNHYHSDCTHRWPEGTLPKPEISEPVPGYPPCRSCGRTINCRCYPDGCGCTYDPSRVGCNVCGDQVVMTFVRFQLEKYEEVYAELGQVMTAEDFRCPACWWDDQE